MSGPHDETTDEGDGDEDVTLVPLNAIGFLGFILSFHAFWFLLLYRKVRKYRDLYAVAGGVVGPRHPDRPG